MNYPSTERQSILVTGIPGVGKTTVCSKLSDLGQEAYNLEDIAGMFTMYRKDSNQPFHDFDNADPDKIKNAEWRCDVARLAKLLADQSGNIAYYCGTASNIDDILPLFDRVLMLKADARTIHQRLSTRTGTDDIGNTEASRRAILSWKDWWENEMTSQEAVVIDAQGEADEIARQITRHAMKKRP